MSDSPSDKGNDAILKDEIGECLATIIDYVAFIDGKGERRLILEEGQAIFRRID